MSARRNRVQVWKLQVLVIIVLKLSEEVEDIRTNNNNMFITITHTRRMFASALLVHFVLCMHVRGADSISLGLAGK